MTETDPPPGRPAVFAAAVAGSTVTTTDTTTNTGVTETLIIVPGGSTTAVGPLIKSIVPGVGTGPCGCVEVTCADPFGLLPGVCPPLAPI